MGRPVVMHSEESPDGTLCIDIRQDAAGYGAALCRRDPEDPNGWRILQECAVSRAGSVSEALDWARGWFGWA